MMEADFFLKDPLFNVTFIYLWFTVNHLLFFFYSSRSEAVSVKIVELGVRLFCDQNARGVNQGELAASDIVKVGSS